jgi:hypothetical protein
VRYVVLAAAIAFVLALGVLTVIEFVYNGVTVAGVVGAGVVVVCGVGVIGAALHPQRK